MKIKLIILLLTLCSSINAQKNISGFVFDGKTHQPLEGVTVSLFPSNSKTVSDERGHFRFSKNVTSISTIQLSSIGYKTQILSFASFKQEQAIELFTERTQLSNITVNTKTGKEYSTISKIDIKMRGVNNSQEVLRIVPGLFIGQHQGGGKAEQIFVRGFDCDHGTDINVMADGMPVNMVSQAHGQGYADMHFIIPETIENVDFQKGPYNAAKGNFSTSGFVDLKTKNGLNENMVKLEGGMFDTYRAMGMFNLLNERAKAKQQTFYIASEYAYSNGYFDYPQHFNRFNFFSKYTGKLSNNTFLTFSASTFSSTWDASGQIPDRAVESGLIGFYGAIDNTEGGATSRTNLNTLFVTTQSDGSFFKNQLYYAKYKFDLHTNFTFFLNDPINGDQIRQKENRDLIGYNGSYHHSSEIGNTPVTTELGLSARLDKVHDLELSHTVNRFTLLDRLAFGDVSELDAAAYINETFQFSEKLSLNAGLRFDQFVNQYTDHLKADSLFKANTGILSPKISIIYHKNNSAQYYFNLGKGFHSNDTRVCVIKNGRQVLPAAYSADLGTILKPTKNILLQAAIWYLWLDQEFVYSGDGAYVEPSGRSQRTGFDLSMRYEPVKTVYFDVDLNYAHGRFVDELKGKNYIPLAPVWSSTGGITYKNKSGINGSLRYRWLSDRPANEDFTLTAKGYLVNDLVINYTQKKYEIGLSINNIFNVKWKETQFDTESRLKNEPAPVDEIHFTPGTKLAAKITCTIFF